MINKSDLVVVGAGFAGVWRPPQLRHCGTTLGLRRATSPSRW